MYVSSEISASGHSRLKTGQSAPHPNSSLPDWWWAALKPVIHGIRILDEQTYGLDDKVLASKQLQCWRSQPFLSF
jgi:hypothetical protein